MFYTYVLLCNDGKHYIGSTEDLEKRMKEHGFGGVSSTKNKRPVELVYYEACLSKSAAEARERYFKTGYGRKFLKNE